MNMVVGEEIAAVVGVENMGFVEMVALVGNMVRIVVGDTVVVEVLVENMAVGVAQVGDKVVVECKDPEPEVQGIVVESIVKVDKVGELVEHWRILG